MKHLTENPLLIEIETYCERVGMSVSEFGEVVMNDRSFVNGLRNGRDYRRSTADRIRQHMMDNPPKSPNQNEAA